MTTMASTLCICATIKAVDLFLTSTSILQLDNMTNQKMILGRADKGT